MQHRLLLLRLHLHLRISIQVLWVLTADSGTLIFLYMSLIVTNNNVYIECSEYTEHKGEIMESLVNLLMMLRLPFAAALVLSTLMHKRKPLALNELVEATGYTKSHLSSALRLLEEKHLIERRRVHGRKHLFQAKTEGLIILIYEHLSKIHTYLRSVMNELEDEDVLSIVCMLESELHSLLTKLERCERWLNNR